MTVMSSDKALQSENAQWMKNRETFNAELATPGSEAQAEKMAARLLSRHDAERRRTRRTAPHPAAAEAVHQSLSLRRRQDSAGSSAPSAMCGRVTFSDPARSARVRATFSTR